MFQALVLKSQSTENEKKHESLLYKGRRHFVHFEKHQLRKKSDQNKQRTLANQRKTEDPSFPPVQKTGHDEKKHESQLSQPKASQEHQSQKDLQTTFTLKRRVARKIRGPARDRPERDQELSTDSASKASRTERAGFYRKKFQKALRRLVRETSSEPEKTLDPSGQAVSQGSRPASLFVRCVEPDRESLSAVAIAKEQHEKKEYKLGKSDFKETEAAEAKAQTVVFYFPTKSELEEPTSVDESEPKRVQQGQKWCPEQEAPQVQKQ